ncbi:MAG: YkgJ family cysteine cluster protein [Deltaproteobacteria bacterium]|nr:YkgJ family cysteine cluster protein [Deltaproteobacteria bacterium]
MRQLEQVGSLRHRCAACGGSCQSVKVRILSQEEEDRIVRLGAELGVDAPVVGPAALRQLRHEGGGCAFQAEDGRCRIHSRYGLEAKPLICRQFPLVATRVGEVVRVGVDPSCFAAAEGWLEGEPLDLGALAVGGGALSAGEAAAEATLLRLLGEAGASVGGVLQALTGERCEAGDAVPPGFMARLQERIAALPLRELADQESAGAQLARTWRGLAAADWSSPLDRGALRPEHEAWALEAVRRVVALRLSEGIPSVVGVALLALGGAVAAAHAAPDDFGAHYAGWLRGLRIAPFWQGLIPGKGGLLWLARGLRP